MERPAFVSDVDRTIICKEWRGLNAWPKAVTPQCRSVGAEKARGLARSVEITIFPAEVDCPVRANGNGRKDRISPITRAGDAVEAPLDFA